MPSEIGASRPLPMATASRSVQNAAQLSLTLARSLGDLLPPGQSAQAEVLGVKQAAYNFQLLLRLTLAGGQQTLVTAESPQALPQGSTLNISALSATSLAATLLSSAQQALGDLPPLDSLDLEQLPVGSLLQGKVLSSTPQGGTPAQPASYRVLLSLLGGPLAGRLLDIDSARPLKAGSLLSAQVQDSRALLFLPLAGRLDRLELTSQLGTQQARQASTEGLLDNLLALKAGNQLPEPLRGAVERLLAGLPDVRQLSDAKGLAQAMQQSGGFLEARLLQGLPPLPGDFKANLLRLLGQLLPAEQGSATPGLLANVANNAAANLASSLPAFVRNALGALNQNGSPRLQQADFPLPSRMLQKLEDENDLESLLKLAAAAVARLQTHQLSSLVQSEPLRGGGQLHTWQMEVPMRTEDSLVPLQVRIQHEDRRESNDPEQPRESLWRIDLAFDLDPLGPLQVQASLAPLGLSSQFWAERESTASLMESELGYLRQRLQDAGFTVRELCCNKGRAPQGARTALEQRWVDEKA
ncbi:flagellar hook-length control protein FliK [Pseudomonas citronellolis]|uniref:flagellar hook-length control protein FliK n=1 Tax=Pseudomonas citronellolis TaxID=53408 RepID=UPI0007189961|nr:flagellar hook-length control protein FliK [Pseudomonas citronellolis]KRV81847.1 flagellar hook-length control protein FliK [Pseudomonas citronellolis]KRW77136.1 flagellar hook-length control protein FliK [Pseudomonas citronellolis]